MGKMILDVDRVVEVFSKAREHSKHFRIPIIELAKLRVLQPEALTKLQRIEFEQKLELAQSALEVAEQALRDTYGMSSGSARDQLIVAGTQLRNAQFMLMGIIQQELKE